MSKHTQGAGWRLVSSDQPPPANTAFRPPEKQRIQIALEKRKKGKVVTIVRNLALSETDLKDLARALKITCGVGGTTADGAIELQGDCRDRARACLLEKGYKIKG